MADWKSIVGTVAPAIATALGGPLAGLGVAAVGKALGLGDGASEDEVSAAVLKASPEQLLSVKKAELEFTARMKELDVDLERIAVADRHSAGGARPRPATPGPLASWPCWSSACSASASGGLSPATWRPWTRRKSASSAASSAMPAPRRIPWWAITSAPP